MSCSGNTVAMAARNASLEPMTEVDPNFIYKPHAHRPRRKREPRETSARKGDQPGGVWEGWGGGSGGLEGTGRGGGSGGLEGTERRRGVWTAVGGSGSVRSRTPAQLRYERSTTSGSWPSLDLSEVEADAWREDSDLDLDLNLFSREDPLGERGPERQQLSPRHHILIRPTDVMDAKPSRHNLRHKKQSPNTANFQIQDQEGTEAEVAILDAYSRFLWAAVVKGNLAAVRGVYKEKKVLYVDHHGNTALHLAARTGQANVLKWLLRYSGVRVTMRNSRSETCAHLAAKHGHVSCLRHILFGGAARPLVLASDRDRQGLTPIHLAAIVGNWSVVRWLVNTFGSPVGTARNNLGQTPLHFAAAKGCVRSIEALCRLGDEITNSRDNVGCTPVYYAAQEGQVLTLRHLVDVAGAKIAIETQDGLRPLQAACQTGRVDIVHFLLQRGETEADLCHQTKDGATVFHMASANGQTDTLALLLRQKGAERGLRMRDCKGSSPAHDAAENGHVECLKLLYAAGLDMHQPDEDGETPYSLASRSSRKECVAYSKVLKHRTSDIILQSNSESSESPESDITESINRDLLNEELSREQLLALMDSEIKKRKRINAEKENTTMPKDKRGLFRRIKDKFDDEKHFNDAYDRHFQVLKKEFIFRSLTDVRKEKDEKKTNISYKQSNRPAAVNMPPGGQSLILEQLQHGNDHLDADSEPVSPKSNTWNKIRLDKSHIVPSGTTRSLRNLAAKIRRDTMSDDEQIEALLDISSTLSLSEKYAHKLHGTSNSPEAISNQSPLQNTREKSEKQFPEVHEVMTQTYADLRDIYKQKIASKDEKGNQEHQQSISTQTATSETKAIQPESPLSSPVDKSPVPPKRAPKLKNLSEYRPLKDKVSIEFESIPEAESNNSSFEKHSNNSSQEMQHPDYEDGKFHYNEPQVQPAMYSKPKHTHRAQHLNKDSSHFETLRPPANSAVSETVTDDTVNTWPLMLSTSQAIVEPQKMVHKRTINTGPSFARPSFARPGHAGKRPIHPKIDRLRTILSDSGVITPYEDHKRCQFPQNPRPQTPESDPNQCNKVVRITNLSTNESSGTEVLNQSASPPTQRLFLPPPLPPPPPPPPPLPVFLPKPQDSQHPTFYLLTSQRDTIDPKANSTPSSSATSGYISPDMRSTPPLISSPRDVSQKFTYQPTGALRGHDALRNEQGSRTTEGTGGKNSGNEDTKESQYWPPSSEQSNSQTLPINVPNNGKSVPWNVSLRRVPPRREKSIRSSELERYFKILEQRKRATTEKRVKDIESWPN